jgi:hypothetical protein
MKISFVFACCLLTTCINSRQEARPWQSETRFAISMSVYLTALCLVYCCWNIDCLMQHANRRLCSCLGFVALHYCRLAVDDILPSYKVCLLLSLPSFSYCLLLFLRRLALARKSTSGAVRLVLHTQLALINFHRKGRFSAWRISWGCRLRFHTRYTGITGYTLPYTDLTRLRLSTRL